MAQTRLIQDLVELVKPNNDDVFVIVDNTTNPALSVTKKISYASLKEDLQDMIDVLVSGDASISASYNDASNAIVLSVVADTTVQKGIVSAGGSNIGTRRELNFIAGSGITLSGVDNSGSNRVDLTVGVNPGGIKITDLNTSDPLPVVLGGTAGTTAQSARTNLGAAKLGANSDITSLSGLTTPLSVSQGGTGGDTAGEALRNLGGLKYITNIGVAGESIVASGGGATLVSNEYRGELKGIKGGSTKVTVGTDAGDISIDVNADAVLNAASDHVNFNGYRLTNIANPIGSADAVNRAYVDQVGAGLNVKEAVVAATTANIASTYSAGTLTLTVTGTGTPSLDGISITGTGTRVLIKNQTTASQNGIYTLTTAASAGVSAVFTRATDYDTSAEIGAGTFVFVQSGTTNGSKQFVQTTSTPTLDTDPLVYTVLNDTTIADDTVSNAKLTNMPALTIKGAVSSGDPHDLSPNEVITIVSSGTSRLPSKNLELGTTTATGVVRLYNGVDSTSAGLAATAGSVKTAYDLANAAMPKSGGTFSGAVSGTTAAIGTNTTQLATTAFVNNEIANDAPAKDGTGAFGTWNVDISGNAASANKLSTARSISLAGDLTGNASFDGTSNITITGVVADDSHNHIIGNVDGLQAALDAKAPTTNPVFLGTPQAPTAPFGDSTTLLATTEFVTSAISGVTGGAVTSANKLTTSRTIAISGDVVGSVSFDGSADVTIAATVQANSVTLGTDTIGSYVAQGATAGKGLTGSINVESGTFTVTSDATELNTANSIVYRDANGNFSASTITATLNGNASTASALQASRNISLSQDLAGTVNFDGSSDITLLCSLNANVVSNTVLSDMGALTIKGAVTSGNPQDLTPNQAIGILNSGTTKFGESVLPAGNLLSPGIVQLYTGIDNASTTVAATAGAVKITYDVAAAAMPKSGGTFSGAVSGLTAASGTNTTQLATTAFVQTAVANKLIGGTVTVASASKTLVADEFCAVINSGLTITLPSSPNPSDTVGVSIAGAFTDTTISGNGEAIMGLSENLTVDRENVSVMLKYVDATRGWRII